MITSMKSKRGIVRWFRCDAIGSFRVVQRLKYRKGVGPGMLIFDYSNGDDGKVDEEIWHSNGAQTTAARGHKAGLSSPGIRSIPT